jgi:hypothetical protein
MHLSAKKQQSPFQMDHKTLVILLDFSYIQIIKNIKSISFFLETIMNDSHSY